MSPCNGPTSHKQTSTDAEAAADLSRRDLLRQAALGACGLAMPAGIVVIPGSTADNHATQLRRR